MAVALILLLVAVGSVLFHIYSPWWWTPIATNWRYIDDTISITFWITGAVFFAVIAFMAYCVFRFHHKEGRQAAYKPENKKLEWWLTIGTAIGIGAMLAPGLVVWHQFVTVPADATEIEVMGQQWHWGFRLPGKDGLYIFEPLQSCSRLSSLIPCKTGIRVGIGKPNRTRSEDQVMGLMPSLPSARDSRVGRWSIAVSMATSWPHSWLTYRSVFSAYSSCRSRPS